MSADIRSFFLLGQKRTASVSVDAESDHDVETSENSGPTTREAQNHPIVPVHISVDRETHSSTAELSSEEDADPDSPWPNETDCSLNYSQATSVLSTSGEAAQGEASSNTDLESECCSDNSLIPLPIKVVKQKTKGWRVDIEKKQKTYSYCSVCCQLPEVCKQYFNGRIPAIADKSGTRFITKLVWSHHISAMHRACVESLQSKELWETQSTQHPMLGAVSKGNQQLFVRMKNDMYDVYNDSKRGTLSAWSWPSRKLARYAAESCPDNGTEPFSPYLPTVEQMQYCNPGHHRECLKYIAECGREDIVEELESALAVCVKVDGHVDAYQVSNKQVAVTIVHEDGKLSNRFVAGEEPTKRGAYGTVGAIKNAFDGIGWKFDEKAKMKISGIATDGEAANTGCHSGLWVKLDQECNLRLLTYWCSCHRAGLAFKAMMNSVPELSILVRDVAALSTFYRVSAVRVKDLSSAASTCVPPIQPQHWPQYKEVRMVEFTHQLLRVFAHNIRACFVHWQKLSEEGDSDEKATATGFLSKWLDKDRLQLLFCFLDICVIFSHLAFKFQRNQLTILDVPQARDDAVANLRPLLQKPKPGSWEELYSNSLETDEDGSTRFFGHQVMTAQEREHRPRRSISHAFVTTGTRDVNAIRTEIIMCGINYLESQLGDTQVMELAAVFDPPRMQRAFNRIGKEKFREEYGVTQLQSLVAEYMPDLCLPEVLSGWVSIKGVVINYSLWDETVVTLLPYICTLQKRQTLDAGEFITVLARLVALSPHNMYVERCISAYDLIKSDDRSSLQKATLNDYMIVKMNMPPVANYDLRKPTVKFIKAKNRRPQQHFTTKFKQQEFFVGFFEEARKSVGAQKKLCNPHF